MPRVSNAELIELASSWALPVCKVVHELLVARAVIETLSLHVGEKDRPCQCDTCAALRAYDEVTSRYRSNPLRPISGNRTSYRGLFAGPRHGRLSSEFRGRTRLYAAGPLERNVRAQE